MNDGIDAVIGYHEMGHKDPQEMACQHVQHRALCLHLTALALRNNSAKNRFCAIYFGAIYIRSIHRREITTARGE